MSFDPFAGTDQLKISPHVEAVALRNVVAFEDLLRMPGVVGVDVLVGAVREAALSGAHDDLAAARAFAVLTLDPNILPIPAEARRIIEHRGVMARAGPGPHLCPARALRATLLLAHPRELEDGVAFPFAAELEYLLLPRFAALAVVPAPAASGLTALSLLPLTLTVLPLAPALLPLPSSALTGNDERCASFASSSQDEAIHSALTLTLTLTLLALVARLALLLAKQLAQLRELLLEALHLLLRQLLSSHPVEALRPLVEVVRGLLRLLLIQLLRGLAHLALQSLELSALLHRLLVLAPESLQLALASL